MSLKIEQIQCAIFLAATDRSPQRKLQLVQLVNETIPELQQVEPMIVPTQENMPPEVPVIILRRPSGEGWAFQYSLSRIDLIFRPSAALDADEYESLFNDFAEGVRKLWLRIQREFNWQSLRVGLIVVSAMPLANAAHWVSNRFLLPGVVSNPTQVIVQLITRRLLEENVMMNHSTVMNSRPEQASDPRGELFVVMNDLNTDAAIEYSVTANTLVTFVKRASEIALEDIHKYGEVAE